MKSEKQELLDRVLLMMKYNSKNTLSENYKKIVNENVTDEYQKIEDAKSKFDFNSKIVTIENCLVLDSIQNYDPSTIGVIDNINKDGEKMLTTLACQIKDTTDVCVLKDIFFKLSEDYGKKVSCEMFLGFYQKGGGRSTSLWLVENMLYLKFFAVYNGLKNKSDILSEIQNKHKCLSDILFYQKLKEVSEGMYPSGPQATIGNFGNVPPPSEICINSKVKIETEKQKTKSEQEIQSKEYYARKNNCPFIDLDEENEFRAWVSENYPQVARELDLSKNVSQKYFCNDYIKKAVGYEITKKEQVRYKPGTDPNL